MQASIVYSVIWDNPDESLWPGVSPNEGRSYFVMSMRLFCHVTSSVNDPDVTFIGELQGKILCKGAVGLALGFVNLKMDICQPCSRKKNFCVVSAKKENGCPYQKSFCLGRAIIEVHRHFRSLWLLDQLDNTLRIDFKTSSF